MTQEEMLALLIKREEKSVEQIKKLLLQGHSKADIIRSCNFSHDALISSGVGLSHLVPEKKGNKLSIEDLDSHLPYESKWEFANGIPFLDGGKSRDLLILCLLYNSGLEHFLKLLPTESLNSLKEILNDRR